MSPVIFLEVVLKSLIWKKNIAKKMIEQNLQKPHLCSLVGWLIVITSNFLNFTAHQLRAVITVNYRSVITT